MATATLDELSRGRMGYLGLGLGYRNRTEDYFGIKIERPLERMREYVEIIRLLHSVSDASYQGKFFHFKSFPKLVGEPLRIPIYFGSSGSRMHQLAGEVADGVILTSIATPAPIQHAKNMLNRGAEIAGRDPAKSTIAASVIYAVAENAAEAAQAAKEDILFYLGYPEIDPLLEQSGFMQEAETIRRVNRERGKGNVLALVNERMLENLAIFGEARHCRAKLEEFIGAGLDVPIIRVSNVPYAEREKKQAFLRALDSLRHFCGGRWAMQRILSPLSCYTWWASPPAWGTRWLGRLSFPALPRSWGLKLGSSG
jgi:5,10-methylenetetrahydromethanopterin reductase